MKIAALISAALIKKKKPSRGIYGLSFYEEIFILLNKDRR
ncbi:hypothetical protein F4694_001865 [Bacillus niacini]|jgi:hypothetical protein|uniref:Uncharacterized protein n=1 Tax=Neobacillus niacini TaxID=86668 RepID=A0A852TBE9_9BACI|nr:hypothetical protein [Neobacillus niacini]